MAKNRFEQVDEVQPDAITLSLSKDDGQAMGVVIFPAAASNGQRGQDSISQKAPGKDCFRAAVRLANEAKVPIVVLDPEGAWDPEWGELYRPAN